MGQLPLSVSSSAGASEGGSARICLLAISDGWFCPRSLCPHSLRRERFRRLDRRQSALRPSEYPPEIRPSAATLARRQTRRLPVREGGPPLLRALQRGCAPPRPPAAFSARAARTALTILAICKPIITKNGSKIHTISPGTLFKNSKKMPRPAMRKAYLPARLRRLRECRRRRPWQCRKL